MRLANVIFVAATASSVASAPVISMKHVRSAERVVAAGELLKRTSGPFKLFGQFMEPNKLYGPGEQVSELVSQGSQALGPAKIDNIDAEELLPNNNAQLHLDPPRRAGSTNSNPLSTSSPSLSEDRTALPIAHQIKMENRQEEYLEKNYGSVRGFEAKLAKPAFQEQVEAELQKMYASYYKEKKQPGNWNPKPTPRFRAFLSARESQRNAGASSSHAAPGPSTAPYSDRAPEEDQRHEEYNAYLLSKYPMSRSAFEAKLAEPGFKEKARAEFLEKFPEYNKRTHAVVPVERPNAQVAASTAPAQPAVESQSAVVQSSHVAGTSGNHAVEASSSHVAPGPSTTPHNELAAPQAEPLGEHEEYLRSKYQMTNEEFKKHLKETPGFKAKAQAEFLKKFPDYVRPPSKPKQKQKPKMKSLRALTAAVKPSAKSAALPEPAQRAAGADASNVAGPSNAQTAVAGSNHAAPNLQLALPHRGTGPLTEERLKQLIAIHMRKKYPTREPIFDDARTAPADKTIETSGGKRKAVHLSISPNMGKSSARNVRPRTKIPDGRPAASKPTHSL